MSAKYLKEDGIMVYSTCTLRPAENSKIVERFLNEHPDYVGEPIILPEGIAHLIDEPSFCLTLIPGAYDSDGFFIAKLRRAVKP